MAKRKNMFFLTNMLPDDDSRGITKKVFAQIRAFENLGYEVKYYTGYKENGAAIFNREGDIVKLKKYPTSNGTINRLLRNKTLKSMAYEFFKNTDECFDCVYLRYLFFDPISIKMFREAKKHTPYLLLEMHSYPNYNKGQYSLYPVFAMDRICRNQVLQYVDKIVAISNIKNIFGKPTFNIDNGIDLDSIKPQKKIPHEGLNIVSVSYSMGAFVADAAIKQMIEAGKAPKTAKVVIFGITFKENCPDTRNSKVNDIIKRLEEYDIVPLVTDPWADPVIAKHEYGINLIPFDEVKDVDCIIVAVGHKEFRSLSMLQLKGFFKPELNEEEKVLIDVKSLYRMDELKASGLRFWRL